MAYRHFSVRLGSRLAILGGLIAVLVWLAMTNGLYTSALIVAALIALVAAELWQFTSRTNRELARFLHAARYADFSHRFESGEMGSGFTELGDEFSRSIHQVGDLDLGVGQGQDVSGLLHTPEHERTDGALVPSTTSRCARRSR